MFFRREFFFRVSVCFSCRLSRRSLRCPIVGLLVLSDIQFDAKSGILPPARPGRNGQNANQSRLHGKKVARGLGHMECRKTACPLECGDKPLRGALAAFDRACASHSVHVGAQAAWRPAFKNRWSAIESGVFALLRQGFAGLDAALQRLRVFRAFTTNRPQRHAEAPGPAGAFRRRLALWSAACFLRRKSGTQYNTRDTTLRQITSRQLLPPLRAARRDSAPRERGCRPSRTSSCGMPRARGRPGTSAGQGASHPARTSPPASGR